MKIDLFNFYRKSKKLLKVFIKTKLYWTGWGNTAWVSEHMKTYLRYKSTDVRRCVIKIACIKKYAIGFDEKELTDRL